MDPHIVPTYDVRPELNLLNSLGRGEHPFCAVLENDIKGLVETFQGALHRSKAKEILSEYEGRGEKLRYPSEGFGRPNPVPIRMAHEKS